MRKHDVIPIKLVLKLIAAICQKKYRLSSPKINSCLKFSSCNGLQNYIRLSFSYYGIPQLEEGVRRLAPVIRNYIE
jgi:DNA-binding transcriptional MocR family regulator